MEARIAVSVRSGVAAGVGAAFTAVVAGQMANAFACRSASLRPGQLGWFSNRFLVFAVLCEAAMLTGFLYLRPLANVLGQAPPNEVSYVVALLAVPAVLAADAIHKQSRKTKNRTSSTTKSERCSADLRASRAASSQAGRFSHAGATASPSVLEEACLMSASRPRTTR